MLSRRDVEQIFEKLRHGLVPEQGLDAFAVGVEKPRAELARQFELTADGAGGVKFLRGGYGCGKTFMARLAIADAHYRNFATSFVVVSDNDLRFHQFDEVYRKVVTELATASCARGALGDILDRWIGAIEEALIAAGLSPDASDFDARVRARLDADLATFTGGKAPQEFVQVLQAIFDAKQRGDLGEAAALVSWLSGSGNVGAATKKRAGIKGDIESRDALAYLRGILEIVKAAGHPGLLIVIDEAETILRMRTDSRHKSLNGIRQICDASGGYPGLLWLFTGTPDFFDSRKGVMGLAPLHDRVRFQEQGGFASTKQPQLLLRPFDAARLRNVALRLRELYPTQARGRLEAKVSDTFVQRLVDAVTTGFKGDVGVVPRQFLRELVTVMDLVEDDDAYDPSHVYKFEPRSLSAEEEHVLTPSTAPTDPADELPVPEEAVW